MPAMKNKPSSVTGLELVFFSFQGAQPLDAATNAESGGLGAESPPETQEPRMPNRSDDGKPTLKQLRLALDFVD